MVLAFDHLVEGTKESFEQMHKLETASERLGIGITALQELHFAFGHLGIDAGEADTVIAKLNKSLGQMALGGAPKQVADAFARLGLSARDAHGEIAIPARCSMRPSSKKAPRSPTPAARCSRPCRLKTEFASALANFFESFRAIENRSSIALRHESEALARQIKLQEQNVEAAKQPRNLLERSLASIGLNRPQELEIRQDEEFLEKLKKQKAEIDAQLARREEENKAKPPPAGLAEQDKPDRAAAQRRSVAPMPRRALLIACTRPTRR